MANSVEEIAGAIRSFFRQLQDGHIRKMYKQRQGDAQSREFPELAPGRPAKHISQLYMWALVNEHDRRQLV